MAAIVRRVGYHYVTVPNEPGEGARVLRAVQDAGVNLLAFHAFPSDRGAQLDFVPEDAEAFEAAAREAGLDVSEQKTAFLVEGEDRPGAAAEVLRKLADARINVTAMDAVRAGPDRFGALLWVAPRDVARAAAALEAR